MVINTQLSILVNVENVLLIPLFNVEHLLNFREIVVVERSLDRNNVFCYGLGLGIDLSFLESEHRLYNCFVLALTNLFKFTFFI